MSHRNGSFQAQGLTVKSVASQVLGNCKPAEIQRGEGTPVFTLIRHDFAAVAVHYCFCPCSCSCLARFLHAEPQTTTPPFSQLPGVGGKIHTRLTLGNYASCSNNFSFFLRLCFQIIVNDTHIMIYNQFMLK